MTSEPLDCQALLNAELMAAQDLAQAAPDRCDVLVAGAGPAGAFLAAELAKAGASVVLCEKSQFPRHKVCGCCLGFAAVSILRDSGVSEILNRFPSVALSRVKCFLGQSPLTLPIPVGQALSRSVLDSALVLYGVQQGVSFYQNTTARLQNVSSEFATIQLNGQNGESKLIGARILVVADGIGGSVVSDFSRFDFEVLPHSRIGIGCVVDLHDAIEPGTIDMYYNARGYLGAVRLETGLTNLAAAVDAELLKQLGVGGAVEYLLSRFPSTEGWRSNAATQQWRGTVALSRKRKHVWGNRIFVVGDAGGYLEPFTGEGMSAALASSKLILPLVLDAIAGWQPSLGHRWQALHRTRGTSDRLICRTATAILHHPRMVSVAARILQSYPAMWTQLASLVNKQYCGEVQQ